MCRSPSGESSRKQTSGRQSTIPDRRCGDDKAGLSAQSLGVEETILHSYDGDDSVDADG